MHESYWLSECVMNMFLKNKLYCWWLDQFEDHFLHLISYCIELCIHCGVLSFLAQLVEIMVLYGLDQASVCLSVSPSRLLLALFDYVSRAHEIKICSSSVHPPSSAHPSSIRVAIISEPNAWVSFKFWLLLPLSHTPSLSRAHKIEIHPSSVIRHLSVSQLSLFLMRGFLSNSGF